VISNYHLVSAVLEQKHLLSASHDHRLHHLGGLNTSRDSVNIVWNDDNIVKSWGAYFSRVTELLLRQKSVDWTRSGCSRINVVGDVINMLPIIWFKQEFVRSDKSKVFFMFLTLCIQTLLDTSDSFGLQIQDYELYQMFQDVSK
jgi:hypothetical protein